MRVLGLMSLIWLGLVPACAHRAAPAGTSAGLATGAAAHDAGLANGLYAVLRESSTADSARVDAPGSAVLVYDRKYTDADPAVPPTWVALDTARFVPLILSGPPDAKKDGRGWTMLEVTLASEQVRPLEEFTRAHLGGRVAIVLGGEVISEHKVRAVVEGGKLQITRCGDNACDVLRVKLAGR